MRKKIYRKNKFKHLKVNLLIIALLLSCIYFTLIFNKDNPKSVNQNQVPYISTYYIKPVVTTKEDVILDFYITDYNHDSYVNESNDDKFTVTIKIDGKKDIIKKNLKAGDHSINLGKFKTEGEQKFSIICTDQYNRNSHELFNYFLVKNKSKTKEYIMTKNDLKIYNIDNNNNPENAINNSIGLQKMLDDKKHDGYNQLKLLPGTYRVHHEYTLYIPTQFTLDLNQATLKLNGFTGDKALMMELNNTFDSHVINGTIEGDYYEHNYENSPNNSEWVTGISIGGESKYSSFENLTVKNITGYGGGNGIANSPDGKLGYTYEYPIAIGDTFKLGDIDRNTGESIESKNRTISDFIDIGEHNKIGYLSISRYLGYQGNPCSTWNLIAHYYDSNKNFIKSVDGYQYRKIEVPKNAKYIKVTILGEDYPTDLSVQLFRIPTHCSFKNITFENCRAVGLAQSAMKDMLVENVTFTNCGQTLAKCAYDAEDGWDMMQDVTFRKLNFKNNPNNDFLTCAGHNFVIEDMIDGKLHFWGRTNSYVVRNNNNLGNTTILNDGKLRTRYVRFYNNTINGNINIKGEENTNWPIIIKDSKINGRAESTIGMGKYLRCTIDKSLNNDNTYVTALGSGEYIDCTIQNKSGENHGGIYTNCDIKNISGNLHGTFNISNSNVNNFNCFAGSYEPTYNINDSTLSNFQIEFGYWHQGAKTTIENCTIDNKDYLLKLPHYAMKQPISLINNTISSKGSDGIINYYDDRTGGSAGDLVKQSKLKLENNNINLNNSQYVVTGINKNTVNNINIYSKNNNYNSNSLLLCGPDSKYSPNISIVEK